MTAMTKVEYVRVLSKKKKIKKRICLLKRIISSFLDNAPNYLFGWVIQKRLCRNLYNLFRIMHPTTYLGALSKRDDQDQKIVKHFPRNLYGNTRKQLIHSLLYFCHSVFWLLYMYCQLEGHFSFRYASVIIHFIYRNLSSKPISYHKYLKRILRYFWISPF